MSDSSPPVPPRQFSAIETGRDLFSEPGNAMQALVAARPWRVGMALVVLISLANNVATLPNARAHLPYDPTIPVAFYTIFNWLVSPAGILLGSVLFTPPLYLLATGGNFLLARLLRGRGSFRALFAIQAFAGVPLLFLAPITLLLNLLGIPLLGGLFTLLTCTWVTSLEAIGLHEGMHLSLRRAWGIVLLPYIPLVLTGCALVGLWLTATPARSGNPALYADLATRQVNTAVPPSLALAPTPIPTQVLRPTPIPPAIVGHSLHHLAVYDVTSMAWSPDGHILAIGSQLGGVQLWDSDGRLRATLETGAVLVEREPGILTTIIQEAGLATIIGWSPDGRTLAVGGTSGNLQLWSSDGAIIGAFAHPGAISSIAWSPDSTRLAVSFTDLASHAMVGPAIRLWRADGIPLATLVGHTATITSIAWSPDGALLASGAHDGTVRLWNADGHPRAVLAHDNAHVLTVAWSPDSATLATGANDGVRLWGTAGTFRGFLHDIRIQTGIGVTALAWSPTGTTLAAASEEGTMQLWRGDGQLLGLLPDQPARIQVLAWSPTENVVAVGYAMFSDTVWLWELDGNLR